MRRLTTGEYSGTLKKEKKKVISEFIVLTKNKTYQLSIMYAHMTTKRNFIIR